MNKLRSVEVASSNVAAATRTGAAEQEPPQTRQLFTFRDLGFCCMTPSNSSDSTRSPFATTSEEDPDGDEAMASESSPTTKPDARPADPFADTDIGPVVWTRIRPTGKKYWLLVLFLAVGLSGFSYYWRNYIVPAQPLVWQTASEVQLRQALNSDHPVLVWYTPSSNSIRSTTNGEGPSSPNVTNNEETVAIQRSKKLSEAITRLDTATVRRELRLRSAELWKIETALGPELVEMLSPDVELADEGLLLFCSNPQQRKFLNTEQISVESLLSWLETTRRHHAR